MRRILIDDEILKMAENYAQYLFKNKSATFQTPQNRINQLMACYKGPKEHKYKTYLSNLIKYYDRLNCLPPQKYKEYADNYFGNLSEKELQQKKKIEKDTRPFYEWVVWAMRYDEVRSSEFIPYIQKMGIKTCVYCNAQFAVTLNEDSKQKRYALYELDHYMPKSKYPFLCTSFFNLQPCCSCCNKAKSNDISFRWFNLYTDKESELNPFFFEIDKESVVHYSLSLKSQDISVKLLCCPHSSIDDKEILKSELQKFRINEIYEQHHDIIEELLWKVKIYDDSYLKVLSNQFGCQVVSSRPADRDRFVLGTYTLENEIHKRPLTKFVQDVAKQLGLMNELHKGMKDK